MSEPPAEDPWPLAPLVPPQNPYQSDYSAVPGDYPPRTARRKRTTLIVLGITVPILAGVITIGALATHDRGGSPATAVGPVASSPASIDEIATPSTATTTPADDEGGLDPRFSTCEEANDAGYGNYQRGDDPEYAWYRDRDDDGIVCER